MAFCPGLTMLNFWFLFMVNFWVLGWGVCKTVWWMNRKSKRGGETTCPFQRENITPCHFSLFTFQMLCLLHTCFLPVPFTKPVPFSVLLIISLHQSTFSVVCCRGGRQCLGSKYCSHRRPCTVLSRAYGNKQITFKIIIIIIIKESYLMIFFFFLKWIKISSEPSFLFLSIS